MNLNKECDTKRDKILLLLFSVLLIFTCDFLYALLIKYIFGANNLPQFANDNYNITKNSILQYGVINACFSTVFFAPISEELLFRSWIKIKKENISFFIASLFCIGLLLILRFYYTGNYPRVFIAIISLLTIPFTFIFANKVLNKFNDTIKKLQEKISLPALLIISSFAFGLMHLIQYNHFEIKMLLFIVPQTVSGFILGYIRMKNGLIWSVVLHAINNLPLIIYLILNT